jgi:putative membrane protein insertion efficiency factor
MKHLLLIPIKFYRKYLSAAKGAPCCRFRPTCSSYAYHAVSEWGGLLGFFLMVWRILRCNPFCKGGYDPVPRRRRKLIPKTEKFGKSAVKKREEIKAPYLMLYERYI